MGGVAEQDGPTPVPPQERAHREQPPPDAVPNRPDHLDDPRMPALERPDGCVLVHLVHPAVRRLPRLRSFDDREEVHDVAGTADRVVDHVCVGAHPELDGVRVGEGRYPVDGYEAVEGAGAGVDPVGSNLVAVAGDEVPHGRAHTVGADHEVRVLDAPVREFEDDSVGSLDEIDEIDEPASQMHGFRRRERRPGSSADARDESRRCETEAQAPDTAADDRHRVYRSHTQRVEVSAAMYVRLCICGVHRDP
ncbi:hypothetical protein [Pseudonocardia sp.]|uniref:hypothetical protein n=1 Tax=Pseudonocardia sp. TaxID=60912 RepID=UPI002D98B153|nr:hypothetical protein [Pseudonocardia sp.]